MIVEARVTITGSKAAVWAAMTDIANAAAIISGIEKIEVVEKPATGLVGLKWRETRMLFGKPATVEKWITEAKENEFYKTRAESDGFVFLTTSRIAETREDITLTSTHETKPQGFVASLKGLPMVFFKGMIKKAIVKDLNDIKTAVERGNVMSIVAEVFPVMPTRPCDFCLCLQGGSVFADFDTDDAGIVSLRRISFDGYGCCHVGDPIRRMNSGDSRLLLDAIAREELGSIQVQEVLRKYFRENKDGIWSDALAVHDLL